MDPLKKYYRSISILSNVLSHKEAILPALEEIERQLTLQGSGDKSVPKKLELSIFRYQANIENLFLTLLTCLENDDTTEHVLRVLCLACKSLLKKAKVELHIKIIVACSELAGKAITEKNWSILEKCFRCFKNFDVREWNNVLNSEQNKNTILKIIHLTINVEKEEISDKNKQDFTELKILCLEIFSNILGTLPLRGDCIIKPDEWFVILFPFLFDESRELREVARHNFVIVKNHCKDGSYRLLPAWPTLKEQLKILYSKQLIQFARTYQVDWVDLWCLMLDTLGPEFSARKNTDLINKLLEVEEIAFRSPNMTTRYHAFVGWKFLVNKFLDTSLEDAARRLKLLMQPLIASNSKTMDITTIKSKVWWQLVVGIEPCIEKHATNVIYHFLNFCYGPVNDSFAVDTSRTNGDLPTTALLTARRSSSSSRSTYPLVTLRRMKGLDVYRFDALAQILNLNTEVSETEYKLRKFQGAVMSQPQTFLSLSKMIIHCVGECTILIADSSEITADEKIFYLENIWKNLVLHVKRVEKMSPTGANDGTEAPKKQEKTEMMKNFFRILVRLSETSLEIKEIATVCLSQVLRIILSIEGGLSDEILTCRHYYVGSEDPMMGIPLFTVLDIFLSPTYITHQNDLEGPSNVLYSFSLGRILQLGIGPPDKTILFTQAVMKRLDIAANNSSVEEKRTISIWITVVKFLTSGYVGLGRDINQGTENESDFTCLMTVLMFPVIYSKLFVSSQDLIVKIWGQLFQAFQQNVFSNVCSITGNEICNSLCGKIQKEINRRKTISSQELLHIMVLITNAIEQIPFHTVNKIVSRTTAENEKLCHLQQCFQVLKTVTTEVQKLNEDSTFMKIVTQCAKCCQVFCENLRTNSIQIFTIFFTEQVQYLLSLKIVDPSGPGRMFSNICQKMWYSFLNILVVHYLHGSPRSNNQILQLIHPLFKLSFNHPEHNIHELTINFGIGDSLSVPLNQGCAKCKVLQEKIYQGYFSPRPFSSVESDPKKNITAVQNVFNKPLTPHQRDVLKQRRDDIPALYQDLTQDSQPLLGDSSQDTYQVKSPEGQIDHGAQSAIPDPKLSSKEKPSFQHVLRKLSVDSAQNSGAKSKSKTRFEKDVEKIKDQEKHSFEEKFTFQHVLKKLPVDTAQNIGAKSKSKTSVAKDFEKKTDQTNHSLGEKPSFQQVLKKWPVDSAQNIGEKSKSKTSVEKDVEKITDLTKHSSGEKPSFQQVLEKLPVDSSLNTGAKCKSQTNVEKDFEKITDQTELSSGETPSFQQVLKKLPVDSLQNTNAKSKSKTSVEKDFEKITDQTKHSSGEQLLFQHVPKKLSIDSAQNTDAKSKSKTSVEKDFEKITDQTKHSSGEQLLFQHVPKKLSVDSAQNTDAKSQSKISVEDFEKITNQAKLKNKHSDSDKSLSAAGKCAADSSEISADHSCKNKEERQQKTIIIIKRNGDNVLNSSITNAPLVLSIRDNLSPEVKKSILPKVSDLKVVKSPTENSHVKEMPIRMCISKLTTGTPEVKSIITDIPNKVSEKTDEKDISVEATKHYEVSLKKGENNSDCLLNVCTGNEKELKKSSKYTSDQTSPTEKRSRNTDRLSPMENENDNDKSVSTSKSNLLISPSKVMVKRLDMKNAKKSTCKTLLFDDHDASEKGWKSAKQNVSPPKNIKTGDCELSTGKLQSSDNLLIVDNSQQPQVLFSDIITDTNSAKICTKGRSSLQQTLKEEMQETVLYQSKDSSLEKTSNIDKKLLPKEGVCRSNIEFIDLVDEISDTSDDSDCLKIVEKEENSDSKNILAVPLKTLIDKTFDKIEVKRKQVLSDDSQQKDVQLQSPDGTSLNETKFPETTQIHHQLRSKPPAQTYGKKSLLPSRTEHKHDHHKLAESEPEFKTLIQQKNKSSKFVSKENSLELTEELNQETSKASRISEKCQARSNSPAKVTIMTDKKGNDNVEHKTDTGKCNEKVPLLDDGHVSENLKPTGVYETRSKSPTVFIPIRTYEKKSLSHKRGESNADQNKLKKISSDLTQNETAGDTNKTEGKPCLTKSKSPRPVSNFVTESSPPVKMFSKQNVEMTECNNEDQFRKSQSSVPAAVDTVLSKDSESPGASLQNRLKLLVCKDQSRESQSSLPTVVENVHLEDAKSLEKNSQKRLKSSSGILFYFSKSPNKNLSLLDSEKIVSTTVVTEHKTVLSESRDDVTISEDSLQAKDSGAVESFCEKEIEEHNIECNVGSELVHKVLDGQENNGNNSSGSPKENAVTENVPYIESSSPISCDKGEYVRQLSLMPQTESTVNCPKTPGVSTRSDWARRFGPKQGAEISKNLDDSELTKEDEDAGKIIDSQNEESDPCNEMMGSADSLEFEDVIESSQEPKLLRSVPKDCFVKIHKLNLTPGMVLDSFEGPVLIAEKLSPISYRVANKHEDSRDGEKNNSKLQNDATRFQDEEKSFHVADNDTPIRTVRCNLFSEKGVIDVENLKSLMEPKDSNSLKKHQDNIQEVSKSNENNLGTDLIVSSAKVTSEKPTEIEIIGIIEDGKEKSKNGDIQSKSSSLICEGSSETVKNVITAEENNEIEKLEKKKRQKRKFVSDAPFVADRKRRRVMNSSEENDWSSNQSTEDLEVTSEIVVTEPVLQENIENIVLSPSKFPSNSSVMLGDSPSNMKIVRVKPMQKSEEGSSSHKHLSGRAAQLVGLALTKNQENNVASTSGDSSENDQEESEHDVVYTFNSEGQEEKLAWIRHSPQSEVSPSRTNLKRRFSEVEDARDATPSKKSVRFSDPEVTRELHFQKKTEIPPEPKNTYRIVRTKRGKLYVQKNGTSSRERIHKTDGSRELKPLYPSLKDCMSPVSDVVEQLADSAESIAVLSSVLSARNISTIGDLCILHENDLTEWPIKIPKVIIFKCVMQAYEKKMKITVPECRIEQRPSQSEHSVITAGCTENSIQSNLKTCLSSMSQDDVVNLLKETFSQSDLKNMAKKFNSCPSKTVSVCTEISVQESSTSTDESDFKTLEHYLSEAFKKHSSPNEMPQLVNNIIQVLFQQSDALCVLQEICNTFIASKFEATSKSESVHVEEVKESLKLLKFLSARSAFSKDSIDQMDQCLLNYTIDRLDVSRVLSEVFKSADAVNSSVFVNDLVNLIKTSICTKKESAVAMFQKLLTEDNVPLSVQHITADKLIPYLVNQYGEKTFMDTALNVSSLTFDKIMESITKHFSPNNVNNEDMFKTIFLKLIDFYSIGMNKWDVVLAAFTAIVQLMKNEECGVKCSDTDHGASL